MIGKELSITIDQPFSAFEDHDNDDEHFMRKALEVAERALKIGEVPVGCVIVLDKDHPVVVRKNQLSCKNNKNDVSSTIKERSGVVISHGANQVNATRDATRHAEIVAVDRLLTSGMSSDQLRLDPGIPRKGTKTKGNESLDLGRNKVPLSVQEAQKEQWEDRWINEPSDSGHWTNSFGWRNNFDSSDLDDNDKKKTEFIASELRSKEIFRHCQLFVTCEVS